MVNLRHPLEVLSARLPWAQIEASMAPAFAHSDRKGRVVEGADLFGPSLAVARGVCAMPAGFVPSRLMVALLYLKHAHK